MSIKIQFANGRRSETLVDVEAAEIRIAELHGSCHLSGGYTYVVAGPLDDDDYPTQRTSWCFDAYACEADADADVDGSRAVARLVTVDEDAVSS